MSWMRAERIAPLAGVIFAILFAVGGLLSSNLEYLAAPSDLVEFYTDNSTRVSIGGYTGTLSALFLVWFAGSLHQRLRSGEGETGRLSAIAFAGGVAAAAFVGVAASISQVAAQRAGSDSGISPESAVVFSDLSGVLGGSALPVAMAVMIGASALLVLRTRFWPAWVGWISLALAAGSLSPVSYIFITIDLLWVLAVGIALFIRPASPRALAGQA